MKKTCLLLFLFIALKGFGQNVSLLNDSAVWRQGMLSCYLNGMTVDCGAWQYYDFSIDSNNDTIINGKTYIHIRDKNNEFEYAFVREDSGKVYVKYPAYVLLPRYLQAELSNLVFLDTTEFLLYDFTLQVGDTFTTRLFHCKYELEWGGIDTLEFTQRFIVDSIKPFLLADGTIRNRYVFSTCEDPENWNWNYVRPPMWIEGIGDIRTFFYNEWGYYTSCGGEGQDDNPVIACYAINDSILYGEPDCTLPPHVFIIGVDEYEFDVKTYPNPTEGIITVTAVNDNSPITVSNILGSIVLTGTVYDERFDLSALKPGIYLLSITDIETDKVYHSRIVKQ